VCSIKFFILWNYLEFLIVVYNIVEVGISSSKRLKLPILAKLATQAMQENVTL
jgi:HJR/Mrr/RecB family endonuclease